MKIRGLFSLFLAKGYSVIYDLVDMVDNELLRILIHQQKDIFTAAGSCS